MKATNKHEFFELLGHELNRIGIEDTGEIFADFEEHFADSAMQGIPEDVTAERLGDIKEIARSYLNLESTRINSIMARDIERKKVSLTKPGRDVPADLSLMKDKDIINSDNLREYTPEHFSEEIYPNSANSGRTTGGDVNGNSYNGFSGGFGGNTDNGNSDNVGGNAGGNVAGQGGAGASQNQGEKSVADAFSEAGKAALDAAKITGQAIVDAFGNSGVKNAVVGAGKSAAEAMKTAGHSAADAVKKARSDRKHDRSGQKTAQAYAAPRPSDEFRENVNNSRKGTIPPQYGKAKTKGGYRLINVSDMKPNVNAGKLITAILLDCLVWSWVLPTVLGVVFGGVFGGAMGIAEQGFKAFAGWNAYHYTNVITRGFLAVGLLALAVIVVCIGISLLKQFLKLIRFVINLHIKAIYDL